MGSSLLFDTPTGWDIKFLIPIAFAPSIQYKGLRISGLLLAGAKKILKIIIYTFFVVFG